MASRASRNASLNSSFFLLKGARGLFEALLSQFAVRDVTTNALNGERMPATVNDASTYLEVAAITEFREDGQLVVLRGATAEMSADAVMSLVTGLLGDKLIEILAQDLRAGVTSEVFGRAVHGYDLAFQIMKEDDVVSVLEEFAETFFTGFSAPLPPCDARFRPESSRSWRRFPRARTRMRPC